MRRTLAEFRALWQDVPRTARVFIVAGVFCLVAAICAPPGQEHGPAVLFLLCCISATVVTVVDTVFMRIERLEKAAPSAPADDAVTDEFRRVAIAEAEEARRADPCVSVHVYEVLTGKLLHHVIRVQVPTIGDRIKLACGPVEVVARRWDASLQACDLSVRIVE